MAFEKAKDLLRLADMAVAQPRGVSLGDVVTQFGCTVRTAQRMLRALEQAFPGVEVLRDEQRRKSWVLRGEPAQRILMQGVREDELTALEMAIRRAEQDQAMSDAAELRALRDRLVGAMPRREARRIETDAEALLEAYGHASRPGPRVRVDPAILGTLTEALKAPYLIEITYSGGSRQGVPRVVQPYGLLLGTRHYLVGREEGQAEMRHFRLDRITAAQLVRQSFARDPDFVLRDHAARAFGSYHDAGEFAEIVWRFSPQAAAVARAFTFHPSQSMHEMPDGSLTVRFWASGYLEMAWHLYQWGDQVEVLAPDALRRMVVSHRRGDFPSLP